MKEKINDTVKWIASALDTHSKGSSARKWSAFAIMMCVVAIHVSWLKHAFLHEDFALMETILIIDFAFIAALLGMTTYQGMKDKPNTLPNEPK